MLVLLGLCCLYCISPFTCSIQNLYDCETNCTNFHLVCDPSTYLHHHLRTWLWAQDIEKDFSNTKSNAKIIMAFTTKRESKWRYYINSNIILCMNKLIITCSIKLKNCNTLRIVTLLKLKYAQPKKNLICSPILKKSPEQTISSDFRCFSTAHPE